MGDDFKFFTGLEIKDADQGIVSATFSTFGVVDSDGDIVEPGAIKAGPVRVSAYGHGSWGRGFSAAKLPIGRGEIHTDQNKAWAEMQFFMDTTHGRDHFFTIKGMGDLQEWSYSLRNIDAVREERDGMEIRRIKSVDVHEVSPVLLGASVGTETLAVKGGIKFQEHIDLVLGEIVTLNDRAREIMALRAEKGKQISEASLEQLEQLEAQLKALHELLTLEPEDAVGAAEELRREWIRFASSAISH